MSGSAEAPGTEESFQPWRDKDPPPGFDGDVEKFKGYLRELKMWRHETDVPPKKHAVKMLRALTGPAKAVCNELEVEALLTEAGADAIVAKLKEYYQPHLETAMPRAFERAVYGEARRNKESFGEFIVRQDALFRELREEGVTLDDTVRGYIMFRQANLSQTQEDQITTWTQGKFDRPAIMAALRKLEKVQRERGGGKHFLTAEEEPTEVPESDDDGEYIYLGEADLDQVFEEEELTEALATYQQVRQAIREQRNGRGYYQPKGLGKQPGGRFGKGSKSSQTSIKFGGKGTKVHIDVLKLRTRCARCGQIGHWAKECTNEPDARGKSRAPSEGTSPKSGFFETGMIDGESSTNTFQVTLGQCLARAREERLRSAAPFSGITTSGSLGIIDTAAQGGLIGRPALRRLEESLKGHGLRVVWNGKQAQAKGIGGDAKVCGVVEIPVGIGGVNGLIEATVVEDEVPFLLSIQFLKQVGAIVNLQESSLALTAFDKSSRIHHMPSGHVAVQVLDFHEQGWQLPDLAVERSRKEKSFRFLSAISSQNVTFMWGGCNHVASLGDGPDRSHPPAGSRKGRRMGEGLHDRSQTERESRPQLEGDGRACGRPDGVRKGSGKAGRLAARWIGAWLATVFLVYPAGIGLRTLLMPGRSYPIADHQSKHLCRVDSTGRVPGSEEVQGGSKLPLQSMQSPTGGIGRSGQSSAARGVVPEVSCQVGCGLPRDGGDRREEEGNPCQWQDLPPGQQQDCDGQEGDTTGHSGQDPIREESHQVAYHSRIPVDSTSECRTALNAKDGHLGVSLPCSGSPADREKGRTDAGSAFLEVRTEGVQLFRMGSSRSSGDSEEDAPRTRRCRDEEVGRAGGGRSPRVGPQDDGDGGDQASGGHGCDPESTQLGGGDTQEPAAVDVRGGGRSSNGGGVQESGAATGDDEQGHGHEGGADQSGASGPRGDADPGLQQWQRLDSFPATMTRQEMERALGEDAPRVVQLRDEICWRLWCKKQLEESANDLYERQVADGFWMKEEDDIWKFHSGILPEFKEGQVAVVAFEEVYFRDQDHQPEEERPLSRASRKAVNKHMKQVVVSEVFSPPRVSQLAEQRGQLDGGAFDLVTGYDLSTQADRRRCWRKLKEADPDIIIVSPPCSAFSILQSLNHRHHGIKAELRLAEGRGHLQFAMEVFRWQTLRKKLAIFEHPATSRAWQEECVQEVMEIPGVRRVRADQCQYGLAVRGEAPNKKPTDFLTNGENTAVALSRRCQGGHVHMPLIGGIARFAQKYPKGLCSAMLNGGIKDILQRKIYVWATGNEEESKTAEEDIEELLRQSEEREGRADDGRPHQVRRALAEEDGLEKREAEEPDHVQGSLTSEDRRLVQKLHVNLGHPNNYELSKALRLARARNAVWRYVKDDFKCDICERNRKPKNARPAMLPRTFEPCRTVGLDVVYFPALDVRQVRPVLNMLDWATGYQMLEPLENTQSSHIWEKFYGTWVRTFSVPEVVVTDQGREFGKELAEKVSEAGAIHKVIGARAPWQQGRTERHGGLAKEVFIKLRETILPTNDSEWRMCVHSVEAAKNRLFNRSGFSPAQRQFGYNMRLPGSLGSDDVYAPELLIQSTSDDMRRTMEIRNSAMQEYLKHVTSRAVARARLARGRGTQEFKIGDVIYVFRVPLQRKRTKSEIDFEDKEGRRATWVGPGVVVMVEGANAWLSIRGELWKCALEQLRHATPEEKEARSLLEEDFEDLRVEMTRKASKRGFKDITQWERPPIRWDEDEEERPRQRPRLGTELEPEAEDERSEEYTPSSGPIEEEPSEEPALIEQAIESTRRCEQLDGTLRQRPPTELYGPTRRHVRERWKPYQGGATMTSQEELEEDDEEHRDEDLWIYDQDRNCIIRKHNQERGVHFTPSSNRGCPVSLKYLTSQRRTVKCFGDGSQQEEKENWRDTSKVQERRKSQGPSRWWVGYTEFPLRRLPPESEISLMVKRGSDEVKEEDIPDEEWEQWHVADGAEWSKVAATGAVKALPPDESRDVMNQLSEAGLSARILPSRMVRRWKPSEQPGVPPTRKSRWCVRGDQDPDLLQLDRHAPTVTTATLSVVLQIAASLRWKAAVGDLKNAFMQSDKLVRPAGRLFCRQPRGGLPGLGKEQLIEILAGAYGLGDAPAHWRKSLKKALFQCGFQQSSMDPCVFKSFANGRLSGLLVVEVDDLFGAGDEHFFSQMDMLRQRFDFGKFVQVDKEADGVGFNGRRIKHQQGTFLVDMEKFVSERLQPVKLEVGRATRSKEDATPEEKEAVRAAVGSLTWAAKEGRPDAAAAASLIASSMSELRVQDILDLNKAINQVKDNAKLALKIQENSSC